MELHGAWAVVNVNTYEVNWAYCYYVVFSLISMIWSVLCAVCLYFLGSLHFAHVCVQFLTSSDQLGAGWCSQYSD